jgi:hypothetical protein
MVDILGLLLGIIAFPYWLFALLKSFEGWKAAAKVNAWFGFRFDQPTDRETFQIKAFLGLVMALMAIFLH